MATVYPDAGYAFAKAVDVFPAADRLLQRVVVEAGKHVDTGAYIAGLRVERSRSHEVTQYHVVSTDPESGPIEWGHWLVYHGQPTNEWIAGQFIMANAVRGMARGA